MEEDTVDSDGRFTIGPHPLIRHNMHEKASTAACNRIVFDDLYPHGCFTVDGEERDGDWDEVAILLEQFGPETVFSDGQIQNGILDVSVAIVVGEWSVEGKKIVFLCYYFQIGKQVVLGSLEGNTEILQEIQ